jgi:hypothetical protein
VLQNALDMVHEALNAPPSAAPEPGPSTDTPADSATGTSATPPADTAPALPTDLPAPATETPAAPDLTGNSEA